MGQVTIYLEDEVEKKMVAAASSARLSKSKWIARAIQEKVANEWPVSIVEMAGSWSDYPDADELRTGLPTDASRESL